MSELKVKSCPSCRGNSFLEYNGLYSSPHIVKCGVCGFRTANQRTKEWAVEQWNRCHDSTELVSEKLEDKLKLARKHTKDWKRVAKDFHTAAKIRETRIAELEKLNDVLMTERDDAEEVLSSLASILGKELSNLYHHQDIAVDVDLMVSQRDSAEKWVDGVLLRASELAVENAALRAVLGRAKSAVSPNVVKEWSIDKANGFDQGYMLACIYVSRILSTTQKPLAVVEINGGTDDFGKPIVWIPLNEEINPDQIFTVIVLAKEGR